MGPVSNFLGGGPKRKIILKAGPTLFLALDENFFSSCEILFGILRVTAKFFVKSDFFPQEKK